MTFTRSNTVAFLLALSLQTIVSDITAQPVAPSPHFTQPVVVFGNNPKWTKITGVQSNTLIRLHAKGSVKFGPRSSTDNANAGVEGNSLFKWTQGIFGSDWEKQISDPRQYVSTVKKAFGVHGEVNFNQGGVWIKIVNRKTGEEIAAPNLFYYWEKVLNRPGFMSAIDVDIYAKAHDGGKNSDSTDSYDDNTGHYEVWIEITKPEPVPWTLP